MNTIGKGKLTPAQQLGLTDKQFTYIKLKRGKFELLKKLITIVFTLFVLIGLSTALSDYIQAKFFDYSFLVGLAVTVVLWFFTSKGGVASNFLDSTVQGTTGIKTEQGKFEFSPNLIFITSLIYTVVTFAAMLYQYRDYF